MRFLLTWWLLALPAFGAVWSDGVDDYLGGGANSTNLMKGATNFTLSCWFYRRGAGDTASSGSGGVTIEPLIGRLVGEADGDSRDGNYAFGVQPTWMRVVGDFESYNASPNNNSCSNGTIVIANFTWYHTAYTHNYSANKSTIYVNGVTDSTLTTSQCPRADSQQWFAIGAMLNTSGTRDGSFNGYITEVAVWKSALSAAEIKRLAVPIRGTPLTLQPESLLGYWPLDLDTQNAATAAVSSRNTLQQAPLTPFGGIKTMSHSPLSYP